ncbi:aminotransferase class I/II-fold pyridoxal phosphate-dependent enzyme [Streptomyces clavifer]|uniref:aminotransferase class I/II-fold pyridoxal phosphate-dependent enzyme n=1 Tax=Streptomyces clavifer TaxID=68188 RepID=UPI0033A02428
MPEPAPIPMSATLAADEALARRRRAGERVLSMAAGEIGLPVLPVLRERLAAAAAENAYGPVAGSPALRTAVAGYWERRGLAVDPGLVVAGPGSKSLLFALLLAIGGDVVVPVPSWVSYAAQARLAGARPIPVPIRPGQGGVPDPDRLREAVVAARAAGQDPRVVVVTVPDNPTGTVASAGTVRRLADTARELDLVIVSDEIYGDLVYDTSEPAVSPALHAPERTVVTTGLTKNLALGGWRTGVARLPDSEPGRAPAGNALLSGFMGTHKKKWGGETAPEGGEFTPPKWFFKGFGDWVRLPGEALNVPARPVALIEEPEVALVYVNDADGTPHYAGYTFGNDLCDIGLHRQDPGYNPYCKLCDTALTPWLFLGPPPRTVTGRVTIVRDGATVWEGTFDCGDDALYYRVQDMADHLFTFPAVRRPGLVNYVLLGADEASFHDGFRIADGDRVAIDVKSHGVAFENQVRYVSPAPSATPAAAPAPAAAAAAPERVATV